MITELNKEQTDALATYRDKWLKIGLTTGPANRAIAEQAAKDAYKVAGLAEPKVFIWTESPYAGLVAAKLLKSFYESTLTAFLNPSKKDSGDNVITLVTSQLDKIKFETTKSVAAQLTAITGVSGIEAKLNKVTLSSLQTEWSDVYFWGSQDAGWLSFYDYFHKVHNLASCDPLVPLMTLSQQVGWTWFYENVVIFSERPTEINRDNQNRLDNDGGAALSYSDGYALYMINGVRVPEWVAITPAENMSAKDILALTNVEQRLVAIKKFGAQNMLAELNAKITSTKDEYVLYTVELNGSPEKLLKMKNPSEEKYHYEWVEPMINTVAEALAWRRGIQLYKDPVFKT